MAESFMTPPPRYSDRLFRHTDGGIDDEVGLNRTTSPPLRVVALALDRGLSPAQGMDTTIDHFRPTSQLPIPLEHIFHMWNPRQP